MPVGEMENRMSGLELELWPAFLERYYGMKYGKDEG